MVRGHGSDTMCTAIMSRGQNTVFIQYGASPEVNLACQAFSANAKFLLHFFKRNLLGFRH